MSKLANKLDKMDKSELSKNKTTRRAACYPLYGVGDYEDKASVDRLREAQVSWEKIQETVDSLLEIEEDKQINNRKFIRHWRGGCSCWELQK